MCFLSLTVSTKVANLPSIDNISYQTPYLRFYVNGKINDEVAHQESGEGSERNDEHATCRCYKRKFTLPHVRMFGCIGGWLVRSFVASTSKKIGRFRNYELYLVVRLVGY